MTYLNTYTPTEQDYAYIAGLIEAEGCLQLLKLKRDSGRYRYSPSITIAMKNKTGLDFVSSVFINNVKFFNQSGMYRLRYMSLQTKDIIEKIHKHLRFKDKQADILLEAIKIKDGNINTKTSSELEDLKSEMSKNNCRAIKTYNLELNKGVVESKNPSPEQLSYIAGLIDGEGSFGIYKRKNRNNKIEITFQIYMNDLEGILEIQSIFGGNIKKYGKAYKLMYHTKRAIDLAKMLLPFLRIKKKEAEICIFCYENLEDKNVAEKCEAKCKELKLS